MKLAEKMNEPFLQCLDERLPLEIPDEIKKISDGIIQQVLTNMFFGAVLEYNKRYHISVPDFEVTDIGFSDGGEYLPDAIVSVNFEWTHTTLRAYGKDAPYAGYFVSVRPKQTLSLKKS